MAESKLVVPVSIKDYAKREDGRKVLKIAADSVEFANSLNRSCWATLIPKSSPDWRLFVGPSIMLLLSAPDMEVEIIPDYSSRKHKMSKRARHVESDQRVTGYPQKTAGTRPG